MTNTVILVVGDVNNWLARGRTLPQDDSLEFVDFAAFSAATLLKYRPEMILSPLTSPGFDALDVAERLQAFRYCGAFRVLAPKLPDQAMVARELRYRAPDVDCELVELNRAPELRVV